MIMAPFGARAASSKCFQQSGAAAIHVLGFGQLDIARMFFRHTEATDQ